MSRKLCYLCSSKRGPCVALHRLPKEPNVRSAWLSFCKLDENVDDVSNLQICSSHFTPDDFLEPRAKLLGSRLRLKPERIPSILTPSYPSTSSSYPSTSSASEKASVGLSFEQESAASVSDQDMEVEYHGSEIVETDQETPKKVQPSSVCKVSTPEVATPRRAKRKLFMTKEKIHQQAKKIKILKQMNRRLKNRVVSLKDLVDHLKKKNLISENAVDCMLAGLPQNVQELVALRLRGKRKQKYSPELRRFALTLQFYSSAAYNYVRKTCDNLLHFLMQNAKKFETYIINLRDESGTSILKTNRKTGFLGLIICLRNIFDLYKELQKLGFDYLLSFKLSQDFIETFFSAIRSRGGFNNNPNARQFESAYKRLLVRHEISTSYNANCLTDSVEILHVSSQVRHFIDPVVLPECGHTRIGRYLFNYLVQAYMGITHILGII